jgi:hypothetical protein
MPTSVTECRQPVNLQTAGWQQTDCTSIVQKAVLDNRKSKQSAALCISQWMTDRLRVVSVLMESVALHGLSLPSDRSLLIFTTVVKAARFCSGQAEYHNANTQSRLNDNWYMRTWTRDFLTAVAMATINMRPVYSFRRWKWHTVTFLSDVVETGLRYCGYNHINWVRTVRDTLRTTPHSRIELCDFGKCSRYRLANFTNEFNN